MTEKRFTLEQWTEESLYFSDGEFSAHMSIGYICKKVEKKLNEQQATINELEKNFDDIVNWASEIAKRNVVLDEQVGELQRENKKLKEEEKLYAQEILRLNTLLKQYQANQDLGGGY